MKFHKTTARFCRRNKAHPDADRSYQSWKGEEVKRLALEKNNAEKVMDTGLRTDIMKPPVLNENEPEAMFEFRTAASWI